MFGFEKNSTSFASFFCFKCQIWGQENFEKFSSRPQKYDWVSAVWNIRLGKWDEIQHRPSFTIPNNLKTSNIFQKTVEIQAKPRIKIQLNSIKHVVQRPEFNTVQNFPVIWHNPRALKNDLLRASNIRKREIWALKIEEYPEAKTENTEIRTSRLPQNPHKIESDPRDYWSKYPGENSPLPNALKKENIERAGQGFEQENLCAEGLVNSPWKKGKIDKNFENCVVK